MRRREFLQQGARALGASLLFETALRSAPVWSSEAPAAAKFPDLAVARGGPREAVRLALGALGGIGRFLKPDSVVAIKPNISFDAPPAWGATTHPEVLAAVIEACLEAGARRVLVVDHTMGEADRAFRRTGAAEAVAAYAKAKLVSLDDPAAYTEIDVPAGISLHRTSVPILLQKADFLINLPKAKSHAATGVSLGLKNLMGLVWDRHVFHDTMDLHQGIADLATVIRPNLTILDAIAVLQTGGPTGPGDTAAPGKIVAGTDPLAVDAYAVGLSTWNRRMYKPDQVPSLQKAAAHALGRIDLGELTIAELG